MSDLIKKAVELADGFRLGHTSVAGAIAWIYPGGTIYVYSDEFPQWFLDALTAQLVRQYLSARWPGPNPPNQYSGWHADPVKTIKAIVDSGVLDD